MEPNKDRLDAGESVFFRRQLEAIDSTLYKIERPLLMARQLAPKVANIGETEREYTYRQFETYGEAKIIDQKAGDAPRVELQGREYTSRIKDIGVSYGFSVFDIRAAAAKGMQLDSMEAMGAMQAVEEKIDHLCAFGSTAHDMKGLVNHGSVDAALTAITKTAGGTTWLSSGVPNATGKEVVRDVNYLVDTLWAKFKQAPGLAGRITVVLPAAEYAYASSLPMGDNADKTALQYLRSNNERILEILPWHKLQAGTYGSTDTATLTYNRAIAYVKSPQVCGLVIPREFRSENWQYRGFLVDVPTSASCGGAIIRYPVAFEYMDGV